MATPGMWKLIHLFQRLFGDNLYLLPYKVSIPMRQLFLIRNMSRKRRCFKVFCTVCLFCHTIFCFGLLCKPFFTGKQKEPFAADESEAVRVVRVYVQILSAFFPSSFLGMNYVITFTAIVPKIILCKIADFQKETQGTNVINIYFRFNENGTFHLYFSSCNMKQQ